MNGRERRGEPAYGVSGNVRELWSPEGGSGAQDGLYRINCSDDGIVQPAIYFLKRPGLEKPQSRI